MMVEFKDNELFEFCFLFGLLEGLEKGIDRYVMTE